MTPTTVAAPARTTWAIDAAHSNVEFAVRHLMITTVKGRFTDVTGTVILDDAAPAESSVEVTIGAASIDTREPQRDAHLRSADFLNTDAHPTLTFRSTAVRDVRGDQFTLVGDLTVSGVTRPVELDVTREGTSRDPWGSERAGFSATTKIKRSDFGLTWNQALETGGFLVGDDVKITVDVELIKQA